MQFASLGKVQILGAGMRKRGRLLMLVDRIVIAVLFFGIIVSVSVAATATLPASCHLFVSSSDVRLSATGNWQLRASVTPAEYCTLAEYDNYFLLPD
mmetsp:Transcript_9421/g.21035  ORF Transcript_9421/g.21035 Transcript_9421/m.21035 type:complete len:97 (-) Transcript_9421:50-340(-)